MAADAPPSATALPSFDDRATFIAGPARSGTTLLTSLLDSHPDLLVLPEETAYFPTVRTKYAARSRREQFDYLTTKTLSNVLFGGPCKWGIRDYSHFPTARFRAEFERRAFDPAHAGRDLLALMAETYADVLGRPPESVGRWVEKTPANRDHLDAIFQRFPRARVLFTLRDPRALLASNVQREQTRQLRRFSAYLVTEHWRNCARLVLRHRQYPDPARPLEIVEYGSLLAAPEKTLQRVCAFLGVTYTPAMLTPTKAGQPWKGNSSADRAFEAISREPADRWRKELTTSEVGWIEWHCRDLMAALGYEPQLSRRQLGHWVTPVRGETPREYLKSRFYSLFGRRKRRS